MAASEAITETATPAPRALDKYSTEQSLFGDYDPSVVLSHPAKFSAGLMDAAHSILRQVLETSNAPLKVLDPFAGVGGIHALQLFGYETVGIELEPEWAAAHPDTQQGDATNLPFDDNSFDIVFTSPPYGNRMADSWVPPEGRKNATKATYRIMLGRALTEGSLGSVYFGDEYLRLAADSVSEMARVLKPNGWLLINVKDHIKGGVLMPVCSAWRDAVEGAGQWRSDAIVGVAVSENGAFGSATAGSAEILMAWQDITPQPSG